MSKKQRSEGEQLTEAIVRIGLAANQQLLQQTLDSNAAIQRLLFAAVNKIAQAGERTGFDSAAKEFFFKNYPAQAKLVDDALATLHDAIVSTIDSSAEAAWEAAEAKNDDIIDAIKEHTQLSDEQLSRYYHRNTEAMAAHLKRADKGFNLSRNVWAITDELKGEMELALDVALGEGNSASRLATEMKKYLRDPDKLFRRVRDKHGVLRLSKAAAAYHPGRGKYRSSYKNALRLSATETNIAYRTADYERWQQMDFVQGIDIRVSHTNHHEVDICDELQGVYPKDFKWTGWHPFCRCNAVPKMEDFDSFLDKQQEYIDSGKQPDYSDGEVTEMPKNFTQWVKDNEERIANASSLPYFLADNGEVSNGKYQLSIDAGSTPDPIKPTNLQDVLDKLDTLEIDYNEVKPLDRKLSDNDIIDRISGGDTTSGSCSSAAFAFAANKGGLDVLDFRGGYSRNFFSQSSRIMEIADKVGGTVLANSNDYDNARNLLSLTEKGKYYYFTCGHHAAIVRRQGSTYEYLELQSSRKSNNTWHTLNDSELKRRFKAQKSHTLYGNKYDVKDCLIDIDLLNDDSGFKQMMGYINTPANEQKKGVTGGEK